MNDYLYYFIVGIIAVIVFLILQFMLASERKKGMEARLSSLDNFDANQKVMGIGGFSGIAVDEGRKQICLIRQINKIISTDILSYKDVLSSEIFEDGNTVTKTPRSSQLGGALIGGLALGGVGAIVGGMTGNQVSSNKINKIELRITVNRTSSPVHDISFMNIEVAKNGIVYKNAMQQARHWHGLLTVLIKQADSEDLDKEEMHDIDSTPEVKNISTADELIKLDKLHKQGLLTNDEFTAHKAKLLS